MNKRMPGLLSQVSFSILFALSLMPRHGYELMKQIDEDSQSRIKLGPGALYGAIKQLNDEGLIKELVSLDLHDRRRYYELTKKGREKLRSEIEYYEKTVRLARARKLVSQEKI